MGEAFSPPFSGSCGYPDRLPGFEQMSFAHSRGMSSPKRNFVTEATHHAHEPQSGELAGAAAINRAGAPGGDEPFFFFVSNVK